MENTVLREGVNFRMSGEGGGQKNLKQVHHKTNQSVVLLHLLDENLQSEEESWRVGVLIVLHNKVLQYKMYIIVSVTVDLITNLWICYNSGLVCVCLGGGGEKFTPWNLAYFIGAEPTVCAELSKFLTSF